MNEMPVHLISPASSGVEAAWIIVKDLKRERIVRDWYSNSIPFSCEFVLALDDQKLYFASFVDYPPQCDTEHRPGSFVEGLWAQDCAELFVASKDGSRYQEFNLAPSGAWWSAAFGGPRQRLANRVSQTAEVFAEADDNNWRAILSYPRTDLIDGGKELIEGRANVTFILSHPQERFYSFADLGEGEPDFHRPQNFGRISIVSGS